MNSYLIKCLVIGLLDQNVYIYTWESLFYMSNMTNLHSCTQEMRE